VTKEIPVVDAIDELLNDEEQTLSTEDYPLPKNKGFIKLQGIEKHSDIMKLFNQIDFKSKHNVPGMENIPKETIEAACWLMYSSIERKFDYPTALKLVQKFGFWAIGMTLKCQQLSGMEGTNIEKIVEDFKQDPFVESTSTPA
jgi:hypothetical protein